MVGQPAGKGVNKMGTQQLVQQPGGASPTPGKHNIGGFKIFYFFGHLF